MGPVGTESSLCLCEVSTATKVHDDSNQYAVNNSEKKSGTIMEAPANVVLSKSGLLRVLKGISSSLITKVRFFCGVKVHILMLKTRITGLC